MLAAAIEISAAFSQPSITNIAQYIDGIDHNLGDIADPAALSQTRQNSYPYEVTLWSGVGFVERGILRFSLERVKGIEPSS